MSLLRLINGMLSSGTPVAPRIDASTSSWQAIDYAHHEIHAGSHYFYYDSVEIDAGNSQDYMITVPNNTSWPHVIFSMDGIGVTQWQLYEGGDRTGTTAQTLFNSNRNSGNTAGITIHKGTSAGTTDGTLIAQYKSGYSSGVSRMPSNGRGESEIILKQNTKYILRVTSSTNDNLTNIRAEWYEHANVY